MVKKIKYEIQTEGFKGWAEIKPMRYSERLHVLRTCGFKLTQSEKDISADAVLDNLEAIEKLSIEAPKFILALDVEHEEAKAKSWDDLDFNPIFSPVVTELCLAILNGVRLGKN